MRWAGRVLWALGEAAVTIGAVVLLLVVHALWWTNAEAEAGARHEVAALEREERRQEGLVPLDGAVRGGRPAKGLTELLHTHR